MINHKAQGTIEYLVIIAIVVVIALVVVGLLLQIMGQGGGVTESSARATWKSSTPFAITDYSRATTTLTMAVRNNSADTLTLWKVCVDSTPDCNATGYTNIPAQGSQLITISSLSATNAPCAVAGTKYAIPKANIYIDYNTATINGAREYANADIVGTC
jgi:hypothetical protein